MAYEAIMYEKVEDKIFRITLNRPEKLNAMSRQLLSELDSALDEFENNNDASVLIVRDAGRAFCAGYDLAPVGGSGGFTVTSDRWGLRKIVQRWQRLWNLPKPTIAQVHGFCLAGANHDNDPGLGWRGVVAWFQCIRGVWPVSRAGGGPCRFGA